MDHRMGEHKALKGLIRIEFDVAEGRVRNVRLTGDFFMYPEEAVEELEAELEGAPLDELDGVVDAFFEAHPGVEMPYVTVEDFKMAIKKAVNGDG